MFDAWLAPRLLGQWMMGPEIREEKLLRLDVDPRVGGRFSMLVDRDGERIDQAYQATLDYLSGRSDL